jgi:hypothetical protein
LPEPITRRRFLRDSAIAAGAVVLLDPSGALAQPGPSDVGAAFEPRRRPHRKPTDGVFAQVEYFDGPNGPIARWTRLGEDLTLLLLPTSPVFDVPTVSEFTATISLGDFEQGRGHHEIVEHFGEGALEQVRSQVAYLRLFPAQPDRQAA